MTKITTSVDIGNLSVKVTFDISGNLPKISLVNQSNGANLAGCKFWFVVYSPTQTLIHEGSSANPDATGAWVSLDLNDSWPMPYNSIEWSGAPYSLTAYVQDVAGNIFSDGPYTATICRPIGNTQTSKNPYGIAATNVKVLCEQARIFFQDQTSASYKGITGTQISSSLRVVYPLDPTYVVPPAFNINNFSSALVPISYSSDNYQFLNVSAYNYQFSTDVFVKIRYQELKTFSVLCNIDLMPLICEYQKLIDSIENGSCNDVAGANRKMMLINPKFALVVIGIMQPLTGIDVMATIEEIKTIGGFNCNCCSASSGIVPQTASVIDGYSFSIVPVCGDVNGTVEKIGNNIQIKLQDKSYVFGIGTATGTTAFSVSPAINGCTKTYGLNVDTTQLATDILTIISTDAGLVNLFNSIKNNSDISLVVNGKCIFTSTATFGYTFTLANVPTNTTFALVTGIQDGAIVTALNFSLNLTNLAAFQAYLNTLGIGAFVVTNPSGNNVQITSAANPNQLSNLTYNISSTDFIATQSSIASGYLPLSANAVVQSIINYLCALNDSKIKTSQPYTITYIDENGGIQNIIVPAGSDLSDLIQAIIDAQTLTNNNLENVVGVSCNSMKTLFVANALAVTGTDYLFGTKGDGNCSRINYLDVFSFMLSAGKDNAAIKDLFCQFMTLCGQGLSCAPYNFISASVTNYNGTCTPINAIEFTVS